MAHIPPGKFERFYQEYNDQFGFPWFSDAYNDRYLELMDESSDVIAFHFYGHHHTDMIKFLKSPNTGEVSSLALLTPGVTPWISTLANETGGNNPGLRLYHYDKTTGDVRIC